MLYLGHFQAQFLRVTSEGKVMEYPEVWAIWQMYDLDTSVSVYVLV